MGFVALDAALEVVLFAIFLLHATLLIGSNWSLKLKDDLGCDARIGIVIQYYCFDDTSFLAHLLEKGTLIIGIMLH